MYMYTSSDRSNISYRRSGVSLASISTEIAPVGFGKASEMDRTACTFELWAVKMHAQHVQTRRDGGHGKPDPIRRCLRISEIAPAK